MDPMCMTDTGKIVPKHFSNIHVSIFQIQEICSPMRLRTVPYTHTSTYIRYILVNDIVRYGTVVVPSTGGKN